MAKKRKLIDYTEWVKLNGDKQNIRVYTYDKNAPVLLFLHGGPGVCDRHWVIHYQKKLAENYTMVLWDQRASGKSFRQELQVLQVEEAGPQCGPLQGRREAADRLPVQKVQKGQDRRLRPLLGHRPRHAGVL